MNDTGIGIPEDMNLAVFEPFRQGSEGERPSVRRQRDGAACCGSKTNRTFWVVKLHHETNEFGGCRFVVEIPLEQAPVALVPETESHGNFRRRSENFVSGR